MATNIKTYLSHGKQLRVDISLLRFQEMDEAARKALDAITSDSVERATLIDSEEEAIQRNTLLSPEGKRKALAKLAEPAQRLVDFLNQHVKEQTAARDRIYSLVYPPAPVLQNTAAILSKMDDQEIRATLAGKPQHELDAIYLKALHDQPRIASALATCPLGPMISAELIARGMVEAAQVRDPENFGRLATKERLIEEIQSLRDHARMAAQNIEGYANG